VGAGRCVLPALDEFGYRRIAPLPYGSKYVVMYRPQKAG
jgi:hypothetical protein